MRNPARNGQHASAIAPFQADRATALRALMRHSIALYGQDALY